MRGFITDPDHPGGLRLAEDLPEPVPADGELVVDVRAYAVNRGELALIPARPEGWQPGQDVAGVVHAAAADGTGPVAGERVVAIAQGGGWAERVAVAAAHCARLPDGVETEQAAALPIAGLTALRALRQAGSLLGRRVLVTGATGGVGQFAVQLARAAGAHVTALVSGPHRRDEARTLGAHRVICDLDDDGLEPFAFVADGIGGDTLTAAIHHLEPGATAVTYGALGGPATIGLRDFATAPNARLMGLFHYVPEDQKGADLATLVTQIQNRTLDPRLGRVDDWTRTTDVLAALAHREIVGKAVLRRT
ncbi:MAG: zinc-binding dehydrogenase [Streptosporangiales bacterium]|nr:zinc-binding dehydrogenase [Streptosporangiales bacterium]